jgi:3-oxoacyl-[acyl-carrier protein] reductase
MNVGGKTAVVTGAGRGVGKATALQLAKLGCHVAINYCSNKEGAEATVAEVKSLGVNACAIGADVREDRQCRELMKQANSLLGGLDVLVNNSGATSFIPHDDLEQVQEDDWDKIFSTNVKGVFQCCRAARTFLERSGDSEIVNVSSTAGILATGSSIPYCASKAAVINMTVSLARALAPGIRVNSVAPGFIDGDWLWEGLGEGFEDAKAERAAQNALGKVCQPEDVALSIVGLIIGSDMVTGQTLVCDGGMVVGTP